MRGITKKIIFFTLILLAIFLAGDFVSAQSDIFGLSYGRALGLSDADPRVVIVNLIRVALTFLGIIAVLIIMYGGWLWMTAAGDASKVDKAKKVLLSAIIGLVLILSAFMIASFVINNIQDALNPQCTPECGSGQKCCGTTNTCINNSETCCGDSFCVTGERCCSGNICASDCGNLPTSDSFYIRSKSPADGSNNVIRNVKIRFAFSGAVASTTVNATTFSVTDAIGNQIGGNRAVSGRQIEFTPSDACPANPCNAANCFAANTEITVTAQNGAAGILKINGVNRELVCDLTNTCTITFNTGDLIDCADPSAVINASPQVCLGSANDLGFTVSDDSGVQRVEFSDSNDNRGFTSVPDPFQVFCPGPGNCQNWNEPPGIVRWQPTESDGYRANTNYAINLNVFDLDSNERQVSGNFRLRPAHCCNFVLDGDETGLNCGGSCALCQGAACGVNLNEACSAADLTNCESNRCASGYCNCGTYPNAYDFETCRDKNYNFDTNSCCVCENRPLIEWMAPNGGFCDGDINTFCRTDADCAPATCNMTAPNGAAGNFVTIGGRGFGTTTGRVYFTDGSGNQMTTAAALANNAATGNPNCSNLDVWQDDQIIVVLPAGAGLGPVTVENNRGFSGTSNQDFLVNTIVRPGLCSISPDRGQSETLITYQGIRLQNNTAFFGNINTNVQALTSAFGALTTGSAQVPNINTGRTTSYVLSPGDVNSNYLIFIKEADAPRGPRIISVEPLAGRIGQYVTIYGQGFGNAQGRSRVMFSSTNEADYDFPDICADSVWSDNQVIVKVPAGLTDDDYTISMEISSWPAIDAPDQFTVNSSLPLLPSLCRIRPTLGPVGSPVSLWGEYFGASSTGLVRFQLDQDSSQIDFWGDEGDANKVTAIVPLLAATGPVRIVQSGSEGNGLNFRIGSCRTNTECGGTDVCCPVGTYAEGSCAADIDRCYNESEPSVYEWDFSTTYNDQPGIGEPCYDGATPATCDTDLSECQSNLICELTTCTCQLSNLSSCGGYRMDQCQNSYFCPNSPGQCSPYDAPANSVRVVGSCDQNCAGPFPGTVYDSTLDRCVRNNEPCSQIFIGVNNNNLTAICEVYGNSGTNEYRWLLATPQSCPVGWTRIANNRCVNLTGALCVPCSDGTQCNNGQCVSPELCSGSAVCNTSGQCVIPEQDRCECCCRKSRVNEASHVNEDCCLPLECLGVCGTDALGPDTSTYGLCTGCANVGTTAAEHDAACNCAGSSGKYCDTAAAGGQGVCRDCAQLSDNSAECSIHNTTCCIDAKRSDACRGGDGNSVFVGSLGYCPYYNCDTSNNTCDLVASTTGDYTDTNTCDSACDIPDGLGLSCTSTSTSATATTTCDTSICESPFACLNDDGLGPDYASDRCGFCCCHPGTDDCNALNPDLVCQANSSPCSGAGRGLCCGCSTDSDCVNPDLGCSDDSCCRPRPNLLRNTAMPIDAGDNTETVNICRNAQMSVEFDQLMDAASFNGNMIVFGEYDNECPAGTQYLAQAGREPVRLNIFGKAYYKALNIFMRILSPIMPIPLARAYFAPPGNLNYCAITGTVDSINGANTSISFSPARLLAAGKRYYVIIKGDKDLDSTNGVKSDWGIGMRGPHRETFNGIEYANAYIWSFSTLSEQAPNNGICTVDRVTVKPGSYLFSTNINDTTDDNFGGANFDKIRDSDKVFTAQARSADGQVLVSIPEYSWTWNWDSTNGTVAEIVLPRPFSVDADSTLLRAASTATEGRTDLRATAIITDNIDGPPPASDTKTGSARVYLFICANPWPPVDWSTGEWLPWIDDPTNCTFGLEGSRCWDTNYELYYCRDSGGYGTYDDLPAILSESTITRGQFNDVLKESYFFREASLSAPTFSVIANANGTVTATWPAVADAAEYRLYWGTASGNYPNSLATSTRTYNFTNLINNRTYYFNLTSVSAGGAESQYSGETSVLARDLEPPATPTNFLASSSSQSATLDWDRMTGAVSYEISYGTVLDVYARSENVGDVDQVEFTDLTNGNTYYFVIKSIDDHGNKSATSTAQRVTPSE